MTKMNLPITAAAAGLAAAGLYAAAWSAAGLPGTRPGPPRAPAPESPRVTARFSPSGGCAALVAWHADRANATLDVASYQWSSPEIHAAVLRTRARGVKVRVILDRAPEAGNGSLMPALAAAGLGPDELRVDDRHAIFHDKFIIRDALVPNDAAVATGSFNMSVSAEKSNAENAIVLEGFPGIAAQYRADFDKHWAHARAPRAKTP